MEFWGLNVSGKNQNILKKSGSLLKVRFFSEHPINFMAKITNPCPGFCLPAVNSCGSQSWQAIRRSREGRCWAMLTHIQQQQLHMFEIMSWSFRFEFYCLFWLHTRHSRCEAVFLSITLLKYCTGLVIAVQLDCTQRNAFKESQSLRSSLLISLLLSFFSPVLFACLLFSCFWNLNLRQDFTM